MLNFGNIGTKTQGVEIHSRALSSRESERRTSNDNSDILHFLGKPKKQLIKAKSRANSRNMNKSSRVTKIIEIATKQ